MGKKNKGRKHSEEAKKKIKENHCSKSKGYINGMKGKKHTKEWCKNHSNKMKGENNYFFGKHLSEEIKRKISNTKKSNPFIPNEEQRQKQRIAIVNYIVKNPRKRFHNTKPEKEFKKIIEKIGFIENKDFIHGKFVPKIKNRYPADFYFIKENLIVEIDGKYWHNYPNGTKIDNIRNKQILEKGYNLLRFWEDEIDENIIINKMVNINDKFTKY